MVQPGTALQDGPSATERLMAWSTVTMGGPRITSMSEFSLPFYHVGVGTHFFFCAQGYLDIYIMCGPYQIINLKMSVL